MPNIFEIRAKNIKSHDPNKLNLEHLIFMYDRDLQPTSTNVPTITLTHLGNQLFCNSIQNSISAHLII